jgi:hypothetical protein
LTMKVAELRAELASRGMDTKGKKAELEARLQALETAVLGADGADASTCIAAPAPGPKTTVAGLRAELASRGLDTKGKKAELEARLLEPEASAAQLTTELRDLKAEHKAERKAKLAKHKAKLSALEAEHKAEVAATEAEHRAKEAALAAALVAQQTKEHKAIVFEEWCKRINDASFDGEVYDAGAGAVAAIVASGKGALIRDISSRATDLVDTDVAALAEHCGELSSIDLDHCAHLTNAAVAAFADACRRRGACSGATGQLGSITFRGCNLIDEGALGAVGTLEGCGVKVEHTIGEVWVRCTHCEESVKEEEVVECAAEGCSATICAECGEGFYERWAPCAECGDKFCGECDHEHMHYCDGDNLACYCKDGQRGYRKGCDETFCTSCAKDHEHDPAWVANALAGYPVDLGGEW